MRTFETILVDTEDQVTTITINRPEQRNAMSPQLHFDMRDALSELRNDPDTRVLVLTGKGTAFCAGQDLKQFFYKGWQDANLQAAAGDASFQWRDKLLRFFPKPTIAMVNGHCYGGAMGVVASFDIVIAAEEATFGFPEVNWGVIPGSTLCRSIPEIMGFRDTMWYFLSGERFDGKKAVELKWATFCVPLADLRAKTLEVAAVLKEKEPTVLRLTKQVLHHAVQMSFEETNALSSAVTAELRAGAKKGIEQFMAHEYRPAESAYRWQEDDPKA